SDVDIYAPSWFAAQDHRIRIGTRKRKDQAMALIPFDDRDGFIWFNGKLVPWRDAKIHVLTHGLHYAAAAFEGERAYNGRVFKSREHSERLLESARILGYEIPYTAEQIDRAKVETMAANKLTDCYVRPIAWR